MFEDLDDPAPPRADGIVRAGVAQRRAYRARRRLTVAAGAVLASVVAVTAAVAATGRPRSLDVATQPGGTVNTAPGLTAPVACAELLPPNAADGTPVRALARLGTTTATLRGQAVTTFGQPGIAGATLTLADGTHTVASVTVDAPKDASGSVIPWDIAPAEPQTTDSQTTGAQTSGPQASDAVRATTPLCLLAGADGPAPVLGLYTGGAHCCVVMRAFVRQSRDAVTVIDQPLGNAGGTIGAIGGRPVVTTADDAFAYVFAPYAGSGMPLKLLELDRGAFVDVTREHLDRVRADAESWRHEFDTNPGSGLGYLAAWAADECLLGLGAEANATVSKLAAEGKLSGDPAWPTGWAYQKQLLTFLSQHGYCH